MLQPGGLPGFRQKDDSWLDKAKFVTFGHKVKSITVKPYVRTDSTQDKGKPEGVQAVIKVTPTPDKPFVLEQKGIGRITITDMELQQDKIIVHFQAKDREPRDFYITDDQGTYYETNTIKSDNLKENRCISEFVNYEEKSPIGRKLTVNMDKHHRQYIKELEMKIQVQ